MKTPRPIPIPTSSGPAADILSQAIREQLCVRATHKGSLIRLAPHILHRQGDRLLLDALVLERGGASPLPPLIERFRLTSLKGLALTMEPFDIAAQFDGDAPGYADVLAKVAEQPTMPPSR